MKLRLLRANQSGDSTKTETNQAARRFKKERKRALEPQLVLQSLRWCLGACVSPSQGCTPDEMERKVVWISSFGQHPRVPLLHPWTKPATAKLKLHLGLMDPVIGEERCCFHDDTRFVGLIYNYAIITS